MYSRHPVAHPISAYKIGDLQSDEVATPQLAVDRQIPEIACEFEAGADGPDLFWKQGSFLADQPSLVPGRTLRFEGGELDFGHELSSIRPSRSMRRHRVDRLILRKKSNGRFRNAITFDAAALPQGRSEPIVANPASLKNGRIAQKAGYAKFVKPPQPGFVFLTPSLQSTRLGRVGVDHGERFSSFSIVVGTRIWESRLNRHSAPNTVNGVTVARQSAVFVKGAAKRTKRQAGAKISETAIVILLVVQSTLETSVSMRLHFTHLHGCLQSKFSVKIEY
ncbi:hypothetical protein [Ruegeria arenilitoris]|uniref:hypothetical protein n=1 Tax=Ruegeria arenilitoris TaxID=1173585 RepID=UPI00147CA388|nr:hypothetical protein [Ruegeria arenilitoris]